MDHIGTVEKSLIQPTLSAYFYLCLTLPWILNLLPSLIQVHPVFRSNKIYLIILVIFILKWHQQLLQEFDQVLQFLNQFEAPISCYVSCVLFMHLDHDFKG